MIGIAHAQLSFSLREEMRLCVVAFCWRGGYLIVIEVAGWVGNFLGSPTTSLWWPSLGTRGIYLSNYGACIAAQQYKGKLAGIQMMLCMLDDIV